MIFSLETACTLQCQYIQRFFDNADQTSIAAGGFAYLAYLASSFGDVKALLAECGFHLQVCQCRGQILGQFIGRAQKIEGQPGSGFWSNAGQALKGIDNGLNGFR
jgi:hypothetical protein